MKIKYAMVPVAGLLLSFTQPPAYYISGNITGGVEGMKIYLRHNDVDNEMIDSAVLHNGKFELRGQVSSPRYCTLLFKDPAAQSGYLKNKAINLFIENAAIQVQAPLDSVPSEINVAIQDEWSSDVIVTGSASHNFYKKFKKMDDEAASGRAALFYEYIALLKPDKMKGAENRENRIALCRRMNSADSFRRAQLIAFVMQQPANEVTGYVAFKGIRGSSLTSSAIEELLSHFESMQHKGEITSRLPEVGAEWKNTAIGSEFRHVSLKDTSGRTHALADYIGKGKYVLVECWASWCGPCRADIPHLKEAYNIYNPHGFEIISVSLDSEKDKWLKATREEKMKWLQLSTLDGMEGELAKAYHIRGIPTCLLFDPQGKLVTRNMRGGWMDMQLITMYGNYFPE